jgi:hypothetical protein
MVQIKNIEGKVLFEGEGSIKEVLELAVRERADLVGADLGGANLGGAYLVGAYLGEADLGGAYLGGAKLGGAKLGGAYLVGANLRGAFLGGAYLVGANLGGANLGGADLVEANLVGANLGGADLVEANLVGAIGGPYSTSNRVFIKFPDQIQIDGEALTVEEWEKVITQREFSRLTIATYKAYRAFLLEMAPKETSVRLSRFERI